MLISVLVPIYGVEQYLERCLTSLFNQTSLEDIEFIFVNDCTQDNSMYILHKVIAEFPDLECKITILEHKENKGLAGARQTALNHATGDYVLTVDADDWIELDTFRIFKDYLKDTDIDILTYDFYVEYANKRRIEKQETQEVGLECLEQLLEGKIHGGTCFKLIKREIFVANNIHYYEGLNMFEDISVIFRVFYYSNKIVKINKPLYHYFQGNPNSYTSKISKKSQANMMELLEIMENFFRSRVTSQSTIDAFGIFKTRVYLQLMTFASSYSDFTEYKAKLHQDKSIFFKLSSTEKLLMNIGMCHNNKVAYNLIGLFKKIRRLKHKIYNI